MKSLIVDFHVGCIQSLQATLEQVGHETHIASYSQHNFLIDDLIHSPKLRPNRLNRLRISIALFGYLGFLKKYQKTERALISRRFPLPKTSYDLVWCCFPPGIYGNIANSKIANKTLVVISHRMDLRISDPKDRKIFWDKVKFDLSSTSVIFVASNEYDAKYFEYYSGRVIPVVEIKTPYIKVPKSKPTLPILIGPAHVLANSSTVQAIRKILPELRTIKENYESFTYDQLAKHKAFVILPYSIYSISLLELSNLGTPLLVPSDEFLLAEGFLNDVTLFPLYGDYELIRQFEEPCTLSSPGPNCDCSLCRKYWLQFAFWKSLPNVLYWNSVSELKLLIEDLEANSESISSVPVSITRSRLNDIY